VPTPDQEANIALNPNAQYRWEEFKPGVNPLPFDRLNVVVDSEAINSAMRQMRALYGYQKGAFDSTMYECTVMGHSSIPRGATSGAFYASDCTIDVIDDINGPSSGTWWIQSAAKSYTADGSARTKLTLRLPLLNPGLQAQVTGAGARKAK